MPFSLFFRRFVFPMTQSNSPKPLLLAIAIGLMSFVGSHGSLAQTKPNFGSAATSDLVLISSSSQLDYTPLQQALAAQDFQRANDITKRLLLNAGGRASQGWLTSQAIETLPCEDLKIIDSLWKSYSDSRFGFSVQYAMFVETGNRPGRLMAPEAYDKFGEKVGWRKDNQWTIFKQNLNYSPNAPVGHLPNPRDEYQISGGRLEYTGLMGRLQACKLSPSAK